MKPMKWVGVLPWTYRPYYEACVATMHPDFEQHVLKIDNEGDKNIGIMKAHNLGVYHMADKDADWLVVMSAAIRFGKEGGLDFIKILEEHSDYHIIHGASANVKGGKQQTKEGGGKNKVFGWHFMAINKSVFSTIGLYDENFSPYGLDDIDLSLRIRKGFKEATKWDTFPCDVTDTTMSHSINLANVKSAYPPRNEYFKRKWGRDGGEWQNDGYGHPFNDPTKPLSYWPQPDDPLSIHQIEFKNGYNFND